MAHPFKGPPLYHIIIREESRTWNAGTTNKVLKAGDIFTAVVRLNGTPYGEKPIMRTMCVKIADHPKRKYNVVLVHKETLNPSAL